MKNDTMDVNILKNTHDLRLSKWGPYTKKYMGISHIADQKKGLRFDLSVFPGFYRRKVDVPSVMWESGYHPWEASGDLSYFSHRHELEWKDRVYCDISFSKISEDMRLIRCECINNTGSVQNLVLHSMASMSFPTLGVYSPEVLYPCTVDLPEGAIWVDGLDYTEMEYAAARPTDSLVTDGQWRGEERDNRLVNGCALGRGFGRDAGDYAVYRFETEQSFAAAVLVIRYSMGAGERTVFASEGMLNGPVLLEGTGELQTIRIDLGAVQKGQNRLKLISQGNCPVRIDGLAIAEAGAAEKIKFTRVEWHPQPVIIPGPGENSIMLKYADVDQYYGVKWAYGNYEIREFFCDELDRFMRHTVHNHVNRELRGEGNGHFANSFLRPVRVEPGSARVLYGLVCAGTEKQVETVLGEFNGNVQACEEAYSAARSGIVCITGTDAGSRYTFSQEKMAATVLSNVVFPVYTKRSYIRHNTPGRWWDCLYTWDSGFIGLGLKELSMDRAIDCLNAYMTEPGDPHAAFIHHGSPVPVQFYLFLEIWNKTLSAKLLEFFYPRLRQYHRFLAGRYGSSTTRVLKSNLIKTWDYFYNSGGWDDYPPQFHVHKNSLQKYVATAGNTSHCIRTAKILSMMAHALGVQEDIKEYASDIEVFSKALQEYSWDEKSGYYGYVRHDEEGKPVDILRHESGANFNMGLDGIYPLVAGICPEEQEKLFTGYIESNEHLWTEIGISTVDQSAPYYRIDGYWNGAVWMPHQWFMWKTMLDIGRGDLAYKIAKTGLEVWKNEVDESYNCFEHFIIQSGRGAGWHHFGGLSTPVLAWFHAYYKPGTVTCGFDVWITGQTFAEDCSSLRMEFEYHGRPGHSFSMVVCMKPGNKYDVGLNSEEAQYKEILPGVLQIEVCCTARNCSLSINKEQMF